MNSLDPFVIKLYIKGESGIFLSFCYFKDNELPIIRLFVKPIKSTIFDLTKFKKIIKRYKRVGCTIDMMRQSASLVVNPLWFPL